MQSRAGLLALFVCVGCVWVVYQSYFRPAATQLSSFREYPRQNQNPVAPLPIPTKWGHGEVETTVEDIYLKSTNEGKTYTKSQIRAWLIQQGVHGAAASSAASPASSPSSKGRCCFETTRTTSLVADRLPGAPVDPRREALKATCGQQLEPNRARWLLLLQSMATLMGPKSCDYQRHLLVEEMFAYHGCFYFAYFVAQRLRFPAKTPAWLGRARFSGNGANESEFLFPLIFPNASLPRALFLGDSIALGVYGSLRGIAAATSAVDMYTSTTNCGNLFAGECHVAQGDLAATMGRCAWDVIFFNNGAHYHGDLPGYEKALVQLVVRMREHSPLARLVFAATTPPPGATAATALLAGPTTGCKHAAKFQEASLVAAMNTRARKTMARLGVTFSDRAVAVLPDLVKYQNPCDVHFKPEGYAKIAESDWQTLRSVLSSLSSVGLAAETKKSGETGLVADANDLDI